jgi:cytochrome bd-type quinol oxidase subunit 2
MLNQQDSRNWKWIALIGIPAIMFFAGLLDHNDLLDTARDKTTLEHLASLVTNISVCILIFVWYRQDAAEHGFRRTRLWDIGVILVTSVVVLPWYLFKSRGLKEGLKSFIWLLAFVCLGLLAPYVAGLILPYEIQP